MSGDSVMMLMGERDLPETGVLFCMNTGLGKLQKPSPNVYPGVVSSTLLSSLKLRTEASGTAELRSLMRSQNSLEGTRRELGSRDSKSGASRESASG